MGQAKKRGTSEERKHAAIKRNKKLLVEKMGGRDERLDAMLRAGIAPFFAQITPAEWEKRRGLILDHLNVPQENFGLEKARSIRVQKDEIAWYLFLCEQTLDDPLCTDIAQSQRILPFFVGIGERMQYASKVKGLERKIKETLKDYKTDPDGLIFEILVALSYAAKGWDVELIEENSLFKSPDMVVRKGKREYFVECKRQSRRGTYSEKERSQFLRLWDAATPVLVANRQWIFIKATFHSEVSTLQTDFLAKILTNALPLGRSEKLIHDSTDATIHARLIDRQAVQHHIEEFSVKVPSPMLNSLIGGDWAPDNSDVTVVQCVKQGEIIGCEAPVLATYVDEIAWACGITRKFDSDVSISKKARDVTKLLSKAVTQVPVDKPSIIHIAAETLEGKDVEHRRTEKVMSEMQSFLTEKPVFVVRFHRFQPNSRTDMLYEFDETVDTFQRRNAKLADIPLNVVVPNHIEIKQGSHWDLYD